MFLERMYQCVRDHADAPALCFAGPVHSEVCSYGELGRWIQTIRHALRKRAIGPGERVAVVANNDAATYAALFAVMMERCAFVPLSTSTPALRNHAVLAQSGARCLVSSRPDGVATVCSELPEHVIGVEDNGDDALEAPRDGGTVHEAAYVLYTSGTTGPTKGVEITRDNLDGLIHALEALGTMPGLGDRSLQMCELTFDLSVVSYIPPLSNGACVYPVAGEGVKFAKVAQVLEDHGITHSHMVPSVLTFLRPYFAELRLEALRESGFCGEALASDVAEEWRGCVPNARIYNFYGPTECTVYCTGYEVPRDEPAKQRNGVTSIGRDMPGTATILVDLAGQVVSGVGEGELCLSGRQLTPGYVEAPDKNAQLFFERDSIRYYRTGDFVARESDGAMYFLGRLDDQVKVQGYRVDLLEIEHRARQILPDENLAAAAVSPRPGIWEIHLFVESQGGGDTSLTARFREHLPEYMVPKRVHRVDALPLSQNGKIDRKALRRIAKSLEA